MSGAVVDCNFGRPRGVVLAERLVDMTAGERSDDLLDACLRLTAALACDMYPDAATAKDAIAGAMEAVDAMIDSGFDGDSPYQGFDA